MLASLGAMALPVAVFRLKVGMRQHESMYIARDLIDLNIHSHTDLEPTERSHPLSVRNEIDAEAHAHDLIHGETDPIDGH